ncbi:dipeptide ABC transporter ATP-binding protein [Paraburkholderia acidisoli]|uniref:Dipeptide ABC transporter ATP-binding protein n=1 Tax=Paraburkholderia acidisoli TaxID=2571748 RepID=A0A7Z2JFQ8_9BURK|nr:ABC transporter ATP-binding protein [Paraburkholderia acidisoli]QGZ62168.1 dipeptide ABC transporter ATP-binding protein [Paraburkholderia acidisoli]
MNASPHSARSPLATFAAPRDDDALALVGLTVAYRVRGRDRDVLTDVSLRIQRGEAYGLVGESGCGKSTVALAALRYLARNGRVKAGRIQIAGEDVLALDANGLRTLRANAVSMVYQDPASALNPTLTIARQLVEAFEAAGANERDARDGAYAMLERVRIADPERVLASYPHQLSGGMQQRVVIAMALASNPALLILDEPTTGLDATVEAEVLDLIAKLRAELSMAVLLISHDLAVIGRMCERVGVLYAGRLVEEGPTRDVFARARHPYTVGLLRCLPAHGRNKHAGALDTIPGELPAPGALLHGCVYAPRCRLADARCREQAPPPHRLTSPHGEQMSRCHYHERAIELPLAMSAEDARVERNDDVDAAADIDADVNVDVDADAQAASPAASPNALPDTLPDAAREARVVLRAVDVSRTFGRGAQAVRALDGVSIELHAGETLGLVGESGSGKTTLARLLLGLQQPDAGGAIELDGQPLDGRVARRDATQRAALRVVFQHPDASLNRALSVKRLVARALAPNAATRPRDAANDAHTAHDVGDENTRVGALLDAVRVPARYLAARARQLSGGLKQRVAIAQAFAGAPRVVICDEPTSALDVSVQAAILNLLARLQRERDVSYLFISHNLDVVRYLADRIAVLYAGRVVESGPAAAVFDGPWHPYTETLLAARRAGDRDEAAKADASATVNVDTNADASAAANVDTNANTSADVSADVSADANVAANAGAARPPLASRSGCIFSARCPRKLGAICDDEAPPLADAGGGHRILCHIPVDTLREQQRAAQAARAVN